MLDMNNSKFITITSTDRPLQGKVQLTGSKSESNRALLIQTLSGGAVHIKNLSEADDTVLMNKALDQLAYTGHPVTVDIGPAGTVMRFMTALLAKTPGNYLLTGSERMQQRPISILVNALNELGAKISYQKNEGYPPLMIDGSFQQLKSQIQVPGNISSQYLSALLLIAPTLPLGLELQITGMLTSKPYLAMTLDMMAAAGIKYEWKENTIQIPNQPYKTTTIEIEPDWSAASYWYSFIALAESGKVFLPGLKKDSLQGDSSIADLMQNLGVKTTFLSNGIEIEKQSTPFLTNMHNTQEEQVIDCTSCPDLAQTLITCAAVLQKDLKFCGLHTLRIKETDRIAALQNEIAKFGVKLIQDGEDFHLDTTAFFAPEQLVIDTYEDHRMAMAFAPLALVFEKIQINDPKVVEKSYPHFWQHVSEKGFKIQGDQ